MRRKCCEWSIFRYKFCYRVDNSKRNVMCKSFACTKLRYECVFFMFNNLKCSKEMCDYHVFSFIIWSGMILKSHHHANTYAREKWACVQNILNNTFSNAKHTHNISIVENSICTQVHTHNPKHAHIFTHKILPKTNRN